MSQENEAPIESKTYYVSLDKLKPHPLNKEIYGDELLDKELKESIRANGLKHPLTVTKDGFIISGNRRYEAIVSLNKEDSYDDKVAVTYQLFEEVAPEELVQAIKDFIVISNSGKSKDPWQRTREGNAIRPSVEKEAEARQKSGKKTEATENLEEGKAARETDAIIAVRVGLRNAKDYSNRRKLLAAYDQLIKDDKKDTSRRLLELANKSLSAALKVMKNENSEEDRFDLLAEDAKTSQKNVVNSLGDKKAGAKKLKRLVTGLVKELADFESNYNKGLNEFKKEFDAVQWSILRDVQKIAIPELEDKKKESNLETVNP